ncbi:hypothetical protein KAX75_07000 [candidate division WOR-3 bacterium]|nr:hypothetical protein [candidate division WOR-3 bacterium]
MNDRGFMEETYIERKILDILFVEKSGVRHLFSLTSIWMRIGEWETIKLQVASCK